MKANFLQVFTLLLLRARAGTVWNMLPMELVYVIIETLAREIYCPH
jgi:hypothetical protein